MHGEGWLSSKDYEAVRSVIVEMCDAADGLADGIVSNPFVAEKARDDIFTKLADYLTPAQIASLKNFYEPMTFSFPLANGLKVMPGYMLTQLLHDGRLSQFSTARENRDGSMEKYGDQVIQYEVVRGANFDPSSFKPEEWRKEILAASEMLDATNPDLSHFKARGGKLLLLHGGADQLVALQGSIDYYNALRDKFGDEAVDEFVRFYFVPGYGHGRGDLFTMNRDLLSDLDAWVSEGKAPEVLIMTDQNSNRSRPLYRFPGYARYKGKRDVNSAESFEPASLME